MLQAGGRHPLQVMVTLHSHVERMLRLEGSGATTEQQAAAVLGLKGSSTFPARKALNRVKALGPQRIGRAIVLLGEADAALRGAQGWPPEQVLEVLVARLARLAR
jgi:DNA polymerase III delta subunit